MAFELIYTSVPQGLKPGKGGFCTIAQTQGLPERHATFLESLTAYKEIFPANDPAALAKNPVAFNYWSFDGGVRRVLARVAFAGLDYSGRSNKIAHLLLLTPEDGSCAGGPAIALAGLAQAGKLVSDIETAKGRKGYVPAQLQLPSSSAASCRAVQWEALVGDAGWAGTLAESFVSGRQKVVLVFEPGGSLDGLLLLGLLAEALALVPEELRWEVTFSTCFMGLQPGSECHWRCLPAGSAFLAQAEKTGALVLDLTKPLGRAADTPLAAAARTGELPRPKPVQPQLSVPVTPTQPAADMDETDDAVAPLLPGDSSTLSRARRALRQRAIEESDLPEQPGVCAQPPPSKQGKFLPLVIVASVAILLVAGASVSLAWKAKHGHDAKQAPAGVSIHEDRGISVMPSQSQPQPATIAISSPKSVEYDGNIHLATCETDPKGLETQITYTMDDKSIAEPVDAGTYLVTAKITNTAYTCALTTDRLVIKPKRLIGNWDQATLRQQCDGKPKKATWLPSETCALIKDDKIFYAYNGKDAPPTEAGTYTVSAKVVSNYVLAENATEAKMVIVPRPIVYSWPEVRDALRKEIVKSPIDDAPPPPLVLKKDLPMPIDARFIIEAELSNKDEMNFLQADSGKDMLPIVLEEKHPGVRFIGGPEVEKNNCPTLKAIRFSSQLLTAYPGVNPEVLTLERNEAGIKLKLYGTLSFFDHSVTKDEPQKVILTKVSVYDPTDILVAVIHIEPIQLTLENQGQSTKNFLLKCKPIKDDKYDYDYTKFFADVSDWTLKDVFEWDPKEMGIRITDNAVNSAKSRLQNSNIKRFQDLRNTPFFDTSNSVRWEKLREKFKDFSEVIKEIENKVKELKDDAGKEKKLKEFLDEKEKAIPKKDVTDSEINAELKKTIEGREIKLKKQSNEIATGIIPKSNNL